MVESEIQTNAIAVDGAKAHDVSCVQECTQVLEDLIPTDHVSKTFASFSVDCTPMDLKVDFLERSVDFQRHRECNIRSACHAIIGKT